MTITLTPRALADRSAWTQPEAMFEMLGEYRRNEPVVWVEGSGFLPFWLVTRYHDIMEIERQPELFTNRPGPILADAEPPDETAQEDLKPLPHRDGEDHRVYRALAQGWFKYSTMQQVEQHATELARESVDELLAGGPEVDFARVVAGRYPLRMIMSILGLPDQDYDLMHRFTQIMVWDKDPDEAYRNWLECLAYFDKVTASRRKTPTGDLASAISNGTVYGKLLEEPELTTYYMLIADAGYETTSFAMNGGLFELLRHPEQLELLRREPERIPNAVEEMLRWTSPARHFMRTAQADTEVSGVRVRKGDRLMLSYAAANRDEQVFTDPERFDVTREGAGKHVAFGGRGPHHCLGAPLTRMEMRLLFAEFLGRVGEIELAGEPRIAESVFLSGINSLPIRFAAKAA
ncbi:cytochrome P450 [Microtetraspora sp. NBRC 13810]|uniref:cytochrome P450 n=1 Tax=Microtetraspora sp. NBRC 13810 TaxID=3030990 RepID=UPI0024A10487|nr:cytochrome P450 [Microtetraspora sp. NBRC 13810]GLW09413.1 cytochrome P450 [Microtetraspora sp. NBRC 13810]